MKSITNTLSVFVYNLLTQAYFLGIKLAANWNDKAKLWVNGRVGVFEKMTHAIKSQRADNQQLVWMHCASLGEFEQGRTVIEALKREHPGIFVLLTFFSPSGYEIRKNYENADAVYYLPADSKSNAIQFLEAVQPDVAIFVKYEFWYHYLRQLHGRKIPSLLIAATFRPNQPFFKWYGSLHRAMLASFDKILVQDEKSLKLLLNIGFQHVQVAGDSRVDRVLEIAAKPIDLPLVKEFCGDSPVLVCGSTWPADEALLYPIFEDEKFRDWKFILAPHDVQHSHIQAIEQRLAIAYVLMSKMSSSKLKDERLLLVDNIGLLSSLYQFGTAAYVGGGFGKALHNTLEPAAYRLPLLFGPNFKKFEEACWFVGHKAAFAVSKVEELKSKLQDLSNMDFSKTASTTVAQFLQSQAGATKLVLDELAPILNNQIRVYSD